MLATPAARAAERLTGFPGFLRANGFGSAGGDAVQALRTAECVGVLQRDVLRWSLKALLCRRAEEWRRFDELFDAWFLPANSMQRPERRECDTGVQGDSFPGAGSRSGSPEEDDVRPRRAASREEVLSSTDFSSLAEREHALEIEALMRRFARQLRWIRLRRDTRARRGRVLDLAGTIRRSVATGGTPIRLLWRRPRAERPRLVLLIDVSRSMVAYSFFYLRLARALAQELDDVHSFLFHTHLTEVSRALRDADPWRAQERLRLLAQGWAGGTRIGESLAQFNREHAARLVHGRTAIVVLSDGFDTGDPQGLSAELAKLRRRARRIVWINPLASQTGYEPACQGMRAALPHLDLLAPGGDLASLRGVLGSVVQALA
jgi:uncharacterized protein with von Willebrand factor type A (vWA) domain